MVFLSGGDDSQRYKNNLRRIWKLLVNYWIILALFSLLGMLFNPTGSIPRSWIDFLKSILLLHSYNGAWWFLNTYIILLLVPDKFLMYPVRKLNPFIGLISAIGLNLAYCVVFNFGILPVELSRENAVIIFVYKELYNLCHVVPYFYGGIFICKLNLIDKANNFLNRIAKAKYHKVILFFIFILLFVGTVALEKGAIMFVIAIFVFVLFNLWQKGKIFESIFLFLGKHSTNIWLTHMFFYLVLFKGLVQTATYPILMLLFLLVLCTISSYVIMGVSVLLDKLFMFKRRENISRLG